MFKIISSKIKYFATSKDYHGSALFDNNSTNKRQQYQNIIKEIYSNGPASLLHVEILSTILKRSIRIWQNDRVIFVIGKISRNPKIDIEYDNYIGHWTLRRGKNPNSSTGINNCLYDVVSSQTGFESEELRRRTASIFRKRPKFIANLLIRDYENLMSGGARYVGTSPSHAQQVLDASQNGQCHPEGWSGHPRGHASGPATGRSEDSVETYSYSRWRSGFLSRADQDLVCHYTLITRQARDLMERLNSGQQKIASHISRNEMDYDPLPPAQVWDGGSRQGSPGDFRTVCLVGKHFLNRYNDASADIFIVTFYPEL